MVKSSVKGTKRKKPRKPKTEKAIRNYIRARMRQLFIWYSEAFKTCKNKSKISYGLFQCEACAAIVKDIAIDHIDPVVPIGTQTADLSLDDYFKNLFCEADNLQALCDNCHSTKTDLENKARLEFKKKK